MTQREKLIELLKSEKCPYNSGLFTDDDIADYLLANGVVVLDGEPKNPPCWTCNHGWGSIGTDGCKSCADSCEELRAYNSQLIAQEEAEAALEKLLEK